MPRYIVERNFDSLTESVIEETARKSIENGALVPGVVWVRSYISRVEGKVYCEYDAPSKEAVMEVSRLAGLPLSTISEIGLEISPSMFT